MLGFDDFVLKLWLKDLENFDMNQSYLCFSNENFAHHSIGSDYPDSQQQDTREKEWLREKTIRAALSY